ncbi:hypothetical protein B5F07_06355 [Lachnoclostridium sp. An169]|nr:hypothetical protein B5F07_06355 [Lachnoclostridium sp. An169]HJA65258.1 hypothetical protein [Candidatus Mediterraneibacter cottocaccae]
MYGIDCTKAVWATDRIHEDYHEAGVHLKDVDFLIEYPNGDVTTRKRLRNKIKTELPFVLQENIGDGRKLIEKIDVVSIQEWNENKGYGAYPIRKLPENRSDVTE